MASLYRQIKGSVKAVIALTIMGSGYLSSVLLSSTIIRALLAYALLLPYLLKLAYKTLPTILWNAPKLVTPNTLVRDTEQYRKRADAVAQAQLEGKHRFARDEVLRTERNGKGWMANMPWQDHTGEFTVCGATVRYVHLKPSYRSVAQDVKTTHRPIVFLHGNPSWSFMWRDVFPALLERGHEVYAVDWLGHGRSDKILRPEAITIELHTRTLMQFFEHTGVEDATLVAHDWGGCVAACTMPLLPKSRCTSLLLLDSFLPPRPSETSLHNSLPYAIWAMTTEILGGCTPESAVMRFLSPNISQKDLEGYTAPYQQLPGSAKSSIYRFSHMAPVVPRIILNCMRQTWLWKLAEGLAGPSHFDNLNAQARLAVRDGEIRSFWKSSAKAQQLDLAVVFGDMDPFLKDSKDVLVRSVNPRLMANWAPYGVWLDGAGHYPTEEKPAVVGDLVARLARQRHTPAGG
ncbi:haloalkane dehalogenase family protein [Aspergillus clavatus NRRL 1]|uniref:Haloalkane dehalogenase family protein n=1 Tax=Aspergillus clavatus (strain ATCC 1007 / CBS 513.65 / DSM 816 / NCTC 3887 / NRRL 1 / QM 1276 / 107) TaxID=344612 RepID=A1C8Q9_ASPCL|nr:haloalkane dehalogenase family protein [Aspergillus clavatus NRRL 1]EAW13696.1 haloalkane dehalogenase family protein [Aspergillus clavatus NRRL 1]